MRSLFLLFFSALLFIACGNESTSKAEQKADEAVKEQEKPAASKKYTLTPFTPSKDFPDAKMESMSYKDEKFKFGIEGKSYKLGVQTDDAPQKMCANSAKGQHIHLIVDNGPYSAKYVDEFDHEVSDGEHYILAFLSRSYHESIKTADAHKAQIVQVKDKSITKAADVTDPVLFYSRPKGTYTGKAETEKVMLDFYLSNVTLGSDYKVKATINGEDHMIDTWQPYYIEGLPMGKNTVQLTLVDGSGNAVDAPMNPVTRAFELKADQLEE